MECIGIVTQCGDYSNLYNYQKINELYKNKNYINYLGRFIIKFI